MQMRGQSQGVYIERVLFILVEDSVEVSRLINISAEYIHVCV